MSFTYPYAIFLQVMGLLADINQAIYVEPNQLEGSAD